MTSPSVHNPRVVLYHDDCSCTSNQGDAHANLCEHCYTGPLEIKVESTEASKPVSVSVYCEEQYSQATAEGVVFLLSSLYALAQEDFSDTRYATALEECVTVAHDHARRYLSNAPDCALQLARGVLGVAPDDTDAASVVAEAESLLEARRQAEERARNAARAKLEKAKDAVTHGDWRKALALCDELDAECPGFRGVPAVRQKAQLARNREEREEREALERRAAEEERLEREARETEARRIAEAERVAREEQDRIAREAAARLEQERNTKRGCGCIIAVLLGLLAYSGQDEHSFRLDEH